MTAPDLAATLQALADMFQLWGNRPRNNMNKFWLTLAEHVEGVAGRHIAEFMGEAAVACMWCQEDYPCPDVRGLLAVAAAAGVKP